MKKLVDLNEILDKQSGQTAKILKPKSQKQQILELLKAGHALSKQEILKKTGSWNSGQRINELRQEGYNIKTKNVKHRDKNTVFGVYFMPDFCKVPEKYII